MDVTFYKLDPYGEWEIDHEQYAGPRDVAREMVENWVRGFEGSRKATIQEA